MAFVKLARVCIKNIPGVKPEVYLNTAANISSITETSNEITAIGIVGSTGPGTGTVNKFQKIQADLDSVQFTSDGEFKSAGGFEQALTIRFSKPRKETLAFLQEVRDNLPCGIVAIYIDNNNQSWLYGANGAAKEGLDRPINSAEIKYDTGLQMTDEDTQSYTVVLKRVGGFMPVPFGSVSNPGIIAATAPLINPTP